MSSRKHENVAVVHWPVPSHALWAGPFLSPYPLLHAYTALLPNALYVLPVLVKAAFVTDGATAHPG